MNKPRLPVKPFNDRTSRSLRISSQVNPKRFHAVTLTTKETLAALFLVPIRWRISGTFRLNVIMLKFKTVQLFIQPSMIRLPSGALLKETAE